MIPLYYDTVSDPKDNRTVKNPIYFIRKSLGRLPQSEADVIILNSENSAENSPLASLFLPATFDYKSELPENAWYDIEVVSQQALWDANVEPNADRDGSLASEPRSVQKLITLDGFIRAKNSKSLSLAIDALNYAFDPVINFLEGSSTFDHTLAPNSQPFNNVGFGVLAWYDNRFVSAPDTEPYKNLNRFMYVRSHAQPVALSTKFDDYNARFSIQLLAIDPRNYEFIGPTSFEQTIITSAGEDLTADSSNSPTIESTETIVQPSRVWAGTDMASPFGPGYREETMVIDNFAGLRWDYQDVNEDYYKEYGDTSTTPGPVLNDESTLWLTDVGGGFCRTPQASSPFSAKFGWWGYDIGGVAVGGGKIRLIGSFQHPSIISPGNVGNRTLSLHFLNSGGVFETHQLGDTIAPGESTSFDQTITIPASTTVFGLESGTDGGANHGVDISSFKIITADPGDGAPLLDPVILIDNRDATYPSWPVIWLELEGNMQAFADADFPPDIDREESPNFARHIKLSAPIELDPAPTSGNPVKVMIDTFNRQMYVDPAADHAQAGQLIHYLSQDSRFIYVLPQKINTFTFKDFPNGMLVGIRWRKAYV